MSVLRELAEIVRDAERYRWLRLHGADFGTVEYVPCEVYGKPSTAMLTRRYYGRGIELDRVIDDSRRLWKLEASQPGGRQAGGDSGNVATNAGNVENME